jgi:uncharacterized protein YrzB (UPF0473 family)
MKINKYMATLVADMSFQCCSGTVQAVMVRLVAQIAVNCGGYLRHNGRDLSVDDLARILAFPAATLQGYLEELESAGLIARDSQIGGWFIPELVRQDEISQKRRAAGKKGAQSTNVVHLATALKTRDLSKSRHLPRQNMQQNLFNKNNDVADIETARAKKEKRTKKEKNNNIYIYIFDRKIRIDDRGSEANKVAFPGDNFTVFEREWDAIAEAFPEFDYHDDLYDMFDRHDRWLEDKGIRERNNWLPLLLGMMKKAHGGWVRADEQQIAA